MAICAVGAHGLLKQSSYSVGFSQTLVVTTAHGAAFVSRAIVGEHDVCSEGSEESRQNRANRHQHEDVKELVETVISDSWSFPDLRP